MKHESREFSTNDGMIELEIAKKPITCFEDIDWSKPAEAIVNDYDWDIEAFDTYFDKINDNDVILKLYNALNPDIEFVYDHREGIYNNFPYRILLLTYQESCDGLFGEFYNEDCRKYDHFLKNMSEDEVIEYLSTLSLLALIKCCSCVTRKFSSAFFDKLLKLDKFKPEVLGALRLNECVSLADIYPHLKYLLDTFNKDNDDAYYAYLLGCIFPHQDKEYDYADVDAFTRSMGEIKPIHPYFVYKLCPNLLTPLFVYQTFDFTAEYILPDEDDTSFAYIEQICEDWPEVAEVVSKTMRRVLND